MICNAVGHMAASTEPKWWEKSEETTVLWRSCVTEDGLEYYINYKTEEVRSN